MTNTACTMRQGAENKKVWNSQPEGEYILHILSSQGSDITSEEGAERVEETYMVNDLRETVFSEHSKVVHVDSSWL